MTKGELLAELTLEVVKPNPINIIYPPKFILHEKSDGITFDKYGISFKGLNRRIRRIIGRVKP